MSKRNSLFLSKKWKTKRNKLVITAILIFLISLNFIFISSNLLNKSNSFSQFPNLIGNNSQDTLIKTQGIDISLLQDPYTINFTDIWDFFGLFNFLQQLV